MNYIRQRLTSQPLHHHGDDHDEVVANRLRTVCDAYVAFYVGKDASQQLPIYVATCEGDGKWA